MDFAPLFVPVRSLKSLREALCRAEAGLDYHDLKQIDRLIHEIDAHRPLGVDGKHGDDMHTATCGCEDKT